MRGVSRLERGLLCAAVGALCSAGTAPLTAQDEARDPGLGPEFEAKIEPILAESCFDCHSGADAEAGLDLSRLAAIDAPLALLARLRRVRDRVQGREMPPADYGELEPDEVRTLSGWAHRLLLERGARLAPDPGRITVRRLSRHEYDNVIRDLFSVSTPRSAAFPVDDLGYGFDNIGAAVSFSALHFEKYAAAAADVAGQVVDTEDPDHPPVACFEAELAVEDSRRVRPAGEFLKLTSEAAIPFRVALPRDGRYRVVVRACGDQAGGEPVRMALSVDGVEIRRFDVPETSAAPGTRELELDLPGGARRFDVAFVNDYYVPDAPDPGERDRNLMVDSLTVVGPLDRRAPPAGSGWLLAADPGRGPAVVRARPIVQNLCERAWRRPPEGREIDRLCWTLADGVAAGDRFAVALRTVVEAVLCSPHFLFRIEASAEQDGPAGGARPLGGYQLAARLSFFLWSSAPDQRLWRLAGAGRLRDEAVLVDEARRMLRDEKATALGRNFAAQWLELPSLADAAPDPVLFPEFSEELRRDMRTETELFFGAVLREQRGVPALLDAGFTFLNERLARHYGIAGVEGDQFRRVELGAGRGGGLLTHASIATLTANPNRTSPVKRGKWILDNLLDAPPPPPPPELGAGSFADPGAVRDAASLREQMLVHSAEPRCAVCHVRMDALGFALERFDPIGRLRELDGGVPIDASSVLPGGRAIAGHEDLREALAGDPALWRCLARKLFVYAVGRDATTRDLIALDLLVESLPTSPPTIEDIILGIVRLDAFRKRRTGGED